jgi:hypothetical protein
MREKIGDDTNPKEEGKVDDLSIFLFPSPCFFSNAFSEDLGSFSSSKLDKIQKTHSEVFFFKAKTIRKMHFDFFCTKFPLPLAMTNLRRGTCEAQHKVSSLFLTEFSPYI